jgi:hypothetical protein
MSNATQWKAEIKRDFEEQMGSVADAVEYVALEGIRRIVQKSPVGNPSLWKEPRPGYVGGRFKGNWFVSLQSPVGTVTPGVDPNGGETISRGQAVIAGYPSNSFPSIYLQNNLPYAERLENGYSSQAPGGMVGLTTVELAALWNAVKLP